MSDKNYDSIINLSHHVSAHRKPMDAIMRAAQFSPFAALTGFEDDIEETARLTDSMTELCDEEKEKLDRTLNLLEMKLKEDIPKRPEVIIKYFKFDERKAGGIYKSFKGALRVIDRVNRELIFTDSTRINIDLISDISISSDSN